MSYDCEYGVKVEGAGEWACIGEPRFCNPTYNLRDMFVEAMRFDYTQGEWYPLPEMLPRFERALEDITAHIEGKYRKYEPENRWGTVESAIDCFHDWVERAHDIQRYGLSGVPFEYIWWRW